MRYDDWLVYMEHNHRENGYECPECGGYTEEEGEYCSATCYKASWL